MGSRTWTFLYVFPWETKNKITEFCFRENGSSQEVYWGQWTTMCHWKEKGTDLHLTVWSGPGPSHLYSRPVWWWILSVLSCNGNECPDLLNNSPRPVRLWVSETGVAGLRMSSWLTLLSRISGLYITTDRNCIYVFQQVREVGLEGPPFI